MKKISVQGMLVGPDYDDPGMFREVERGVFCPSSKVLREMDEANGDDLEIHINSEGGDVFAFNEVANRIASYPADVKIVIGSCAFSEAANLALTCGKPIYVHPNSVMLWHSAMSTVYDGGAGELKAEAEIIEKINAPIKWALKMHGIPESEVEEAFQDRNALVLGADELIQYNIARPYTFEGADERFQRRDEEMSKRLVALAEANQRIAAHYHSTKVNNSEMKAEENKETLECPIKEHETEEAIKAEETTTDDEEKKVEETAEETTEEQKPEEEAPAEETTEEQPTEETTEEETTEEEKPEETKEQAEESDDDQLLKTLEVLQGSVSTLTDRLNALEEKLTEKEVELQDAKKALKAERTKRIGALAAAVSGKTESNQPADWPAAVKACKGDKLEAYKKYPELARAWTKTN